MDFYWIKRTDGLQSGVELVNRIDKVKFQRLLSHIVKIIAERSDLALFTTEELSVLEKVLKLESNEVTLVIKTIRHILRRMTKFVMRPVCILNDLTGVLNMNEEKALLFVEKYKYVLKTVTDDFGVTNFADIEELDKCYWQVNLEMTSSKNQLERSTTVLLDLQTNKKDKPINNKEFIEFDSEELKNFHQQMDLIQSELDNLINT